MGFLRAVTAMGPTFVWIACLLGSGCMLAGNGPDPPASSFYYPTAAAVSPRGTTLYVANADFDLQYNAGTVQAIDLSRVRSMLAPLWDPAEAGDPNVCARVGSAIHHLDPNPSQVIYPGPCGPLDISQPVDDAGPLVRTSAKLGAFATQVLFVCKPPEGQVGAGARCEGPSPTSARLFVAVRGDPSLTYFDVDDDRAAGATSFRLDCGQGPAGGRCDANHRLGTAPNDNTHGLTMPSEPFDLAVSDGAEAIVVTHQTTGSVSLFTSPTPGGTQPASTVFDHPGLQFILSGLPSGTIDIAPIPVPAFAREARAPVAPTDSYEPGFIVDYRNAPEIDVVRLLGDTTTWPGNPYFSLARTGTVPVTALASGVDSRGILIDRSSRDACEAACGVGVDRSQCLLACARASLPVYIASRTPPSLLIGETVSRPDLASGRFSGASLYNETVRFYDALPLSTGPSRIVMGAVRGRDGQASSRVFVVCFDTRRVVVYDPVRRTIEGQIRTGRGPQAFLLDPVLPIGYVLHFADSYIGIVDLDEGHPATFETMVASVGVPIPPQVTK